MGKLARHRKKRSNPPDKGVKELAVDVAVGTAGYAVTRFLARVVYSRVPARFARHAHVAASALGAVGVFLGTRYVRQAEPFHEAATVGAGIAFAQSVIQTYAPERVAWVTADVSGEYAADQRAPAAASVEVAEIDMGDYVEVDNVPQLEGAGVHEPVSIPEDFELHVVS